MRIALINYAFPTRSETFIREKAARLAELGHRVRIFVRKQNASTAPPGRLLPGDVRVVELYRSDWPALAKLRYGLFWFARDFFRALRLYQEAHRSTELSLSEFVHIAPILLFEPDVVHIEMISLLTMYSGLLRAVNCAKIVSCRGSDIAVGPLLNPGARQSGIEAIQTVDRVHCLGDWTMRLLVDRYKCPAEKIARIAPGVDVRLFPPKKPGALMTRIVVGTVGRLHWVKGHVYALQAIRILVDQGVDVQYRIAGDGEEKENLLYDITDLGLSSYVEVIPWLSREKVLEFLNGIDVYLLPSISEGFGNSVLEAMSVGNPVIVTDVGCAEAITDGVEGFVVRRRSPCAIADRVQYLYKHASLIRKMGLAGRQRVERLYRVEDQIRALASLYDETLMQRRREERR